LNNASMDATIGRNAAGAAGGPFDLYSRASIDEVMLAGRALAATEVQALAGRTAVPNAGAGVIILSGATDSTIGGSAASARNVISGNTGSGIEVAGAGTLRTVIIGNSIGINLAGSAALPNARGIVVRYGAQDTRIGSAAG